MKSVWSEAPLTLRIYLGAAVASALVFVGFFSSSAKEIAWLIGALVLTYLMLRGVRWAWIFILVSTVVFQAIRIVAGAEWINVGIDTVALGLLLAPETWRFFRRDRRGGIRLTENWAVRAGAITIGLLLVWLACFAIGGVVKYVGLIAFLGMLISAFFALTLSVSGLFTLAREPRKQS